MKHKSRIVDQENEVQCGTSIFALTDSEIEKLNENCENGNAESALKLYKYYQYFKLDWKKAAQYLNKSATHGNRVAQYNLALFYLNEVPSDFYKNDPVAGRYWLEQAKAQGHPGAIKLSERLNLKSD